MGIKCNKWLLDGNKKTFIELKLGVPGHWIACLAYPGRAHVQSVNYVQYKLTLAELDRPPIPAKITIPIIMISPEYKSINKKKKIRL